MRVLPLLWMALLAGCMPRTPPLEPAQFQNGTAGYRYRNVHQETGTKGDETLLLVSLSGGGTRAAAFAYGVLDEMRRSSLPDGRTLVDEIDAISSVSGGSFAAAYLALYGQKRFFEDFRAEVLERQIEVAYGLRILAPWNWPWLWSPRFGRGDLAAEYYESIFGPRTFADLMHRQPFVSLNATDIGIGAQFSFTQEHFDRICADLSKVPIARAVAASSAFPVAFTPLTLENRPKTDCGYVAPRWVERAEADFETAPENWQLARTWRSYEDATKRPYIHLSDGGLSDNIGLRAFEQEFITNDWDIVGALNSRRLQRIVVIAVDAKPRAPACMDQSAHPPSWPFVLEAAATNPMENYSSDTIERFREWVDSWRNENLDLVARRHECEDLVGGICGRDAACRTRNRRRCDSISTPANPNLSLHLIHVRFDAIEPPDVRERVQGIGTRLQLSSEEVGLLIDWGRWLLQQSDEYQQVLSEMRATVEAVR